MDIKPCNILMIKNNNNKQFILKLSDFGPSR